MDKFARLQQSTNEFTVKEPQIIKYVTSLENMKARFKQLEIEPISRNLNSSTDALTKLAFAFNGGGQREINRFRLSHMRKKIGGFLMQSQHYQAP